LQLWKDPLFIKSHFCYIKFTRSFFEIVEKFKQLNITKTLLAHNVQLVFCVNFIFTITIARDRHRNSRLQYKGSNSKSQIFIHKLGVLVWGCVRARWDQNFWIRTRTLTALWISESDSRSEIRSSCFRLCVVITRTLDMCLRQYWCWPNNNQVIIRFYFGSSVTYLQ
jgi:hypothetical protein